VHGMDVWRGGRVWFHPQQNKTCFLGLWAQHASTSITTTTATARHIPPDHKPHHVTTPTPIHPSIDQVLCRVRPVLPVEVAAAGGKDVTEIPSPEDIVITKEDRSKARFEFDRVFAPGSTQQEVFEAVQPMVVSFMDGYNVRACVRA
jgi:hypothetical protein